MEGTSRVFALAISFNIYYVIHLIVWLALSIFHCRRLYSYRTLLTLKSRNFLYFFHTLSFLTAFAEVSLSIGQNACAWLPSNGSYFRWDQSWVCPGSSDAAAFGNYLILTIRGLSGVFLVFLLAVITWFCRKEVVCTHHGLWHWKAGHRVETVIIYSVVIFAVLSTVWQVIGKVYAKRGSEGWTQAALFSFIPDAIACLVVLVQSFILWQTINFTQHTMPFVSTRSLFLSIFFLASASVGNNYALTGFVTQQTDPSNLYVFASALYIASSLAIPTSSAFLAYLFRQPPQFEETDSLLPSSRDVD